ncbi:MAG: DNA gyrase inhibitor YacG [Pseudomonadota bacterium]
MSCPICGENAAIKFRPFCSRRCADIDLAKWLNGSYAIPLPAEDEAESDGLGKDPGVSRPH